MAATGFYIAFFDFVNRVGIPQVYQNGGNMGFEGVELENNSQLAWRQTTVNSMTHQTNKWKGSRSTTSVPHRTAKMGAACQYLDKVLHAMLFDSYFGISATKPFTPPRPKSPEILDPRTCEPQLHA